MNIPIVAKIALCILLTSLSWPARSQDQYEYRVEHFTPEDGLSSNSVYTIQEDSLGFLWLGTMNGLVRYDGYTFETFLPRQGDSTSIGGSHIVALHVDAKGHLWAGGGYQDPHRAQSLRPDHQCIHVVLASPGPRSRRPSQCCRFHL